LSHCPPSVSRGRRAFITEGGPSEIVPVNLDIGINERRRKKRDREIFLFFGKMNQKISLGSNRKKRKEKEKKGGIFQSSFRTSSKEKEKKEKKKKNW